MEITNVSKSKKKMVFEIEGEGHTFANILRDELWEQKGVISSGYSIRHPLVGRPKFIAETDSSSDVKAALEGAAKSVKSLTADFKKGFSKM